MACNNLLLCLFGISTCFVVGIVAREAIINGFLAKDNQFPYQVSLVVSGRIRKGHICGGGIISEYHIITAAHCAVGSKGRFRTDPMTVVAGTSDLRKAGEPAVIIKVREIFVPDEYKPPKWTVDNIAVLKLNSSLDFSKHKHLKALKLPKRGHMNEKPVVAEIAGWGWQWMVEDGTNGGRLDTYLRFLKTDILKPSQHNEINSPQLVLEKQFCVRVRQFDNHNVSRSVCAGDDGGPLVHDETVIGILSEIPDYCSERKSAAIYTRVTWYTSFIESILENNVSRYARTHLLDVS